MPEENKYSAERRRYVRLCAQHMLMHEKYVFETREDDNLAEGILGNYSAGGVLFESKVKYDIEDLLKLEISIPGWEQFKNEFYKDDVATSSKPIVVLAVVVRVENIVANELYDIGVCFVAVDEHHRWALKKQIECERKKRESS